MSSVPGAVGKALHSNPFLTKADVISLQNEMMDLNVVTEDDALRRLLVWDLHIRKRTQSFRAGQDVKKLHDRDLKTFNFQRIKPAQTSIKSYPLDHTVTGTLTPLSDDTKLSAKGCGVHTDGASYITIASNSRLNPTDELSIIIEGYIPAVPGSDLILMIKGSQYKVTIKTTGVLEFAVYNNIGGGFTNVVNVSFTANQWVYAIFTYKQGVGSKALKDGSQVDSATSYTGTLHTTSNSLIIFADAGGSTPMASGSRLGLFGMLHEDVNTVTDWVSDFHTKHIYNTKDAEEILTYENAGKVTPTPDASLGGF